MWIICAKCISAGAHTYNDVSSDQKSDFFLSHMYDFIRP